MSLLYKHLRIHQIFGANTDVGKTILSTGLVRASALKGRSVFYLKPVSTGPLTQADDQHVTRYSAQLKDRIISKCLYQFSEPVSPHLAVNIDNAVSPTDETFVNSVATYIKKCASETERESYMYLETAGGVHSPTLSGTTQLDCYRPLFLPTVLIGDSRLGGISSTISAYESMLLRGFIVDAIVLFKDEYYRNWEYLKAYFAERGVWVSAVDPPPEILPDPKANFSITEKYYETISNPDNDTGIGGVVDHLTECHAKRLEDLSSMSSRARSAVWWPFVQHGLVNGDQDVTVIDSAQSDFFNTYHSRTESSSSALRPTFDGSASWWTQAFGHGNPALTLAASAASGRYGHVIFPQAVHAPALRLAERLVQKGPGKGWASRAFFSDDGATAMEVALKMALRTFSRESGVSAADYKQLGIVGLKGSYHGDTIGAMDACEEGVYTCEWHDAKGFWFEPPSVSFKHGVVTISVPSLVKANEHDIVAPSLPWVYDIPARLHTPLAQVYRNHVEFALSNISTPIATLVLEPLLMGAGGMIFVDPLFQRVLVDVARTRTPALPVIFDEVFVGLYRIGMESTIPLLGVTPDISVNAKVLTGGLLPMAVTLANDRVFQAFLSTSKADALLHGHSYTANPVGCAVANAALDLIEKVARSEEWVDARGRWAPSDDAASKFAQIWSLWDPTFVRTLSQMDRVDRVMAMGTVLAVTVKDSAPGYTSHSAKSAFQALSQVANNDRQPLSPAPGGAPFDVHYRTLGNVAYFMTSLNSSASTVRALEDKIWRALSELS
ncbi:PLP-dependent transferase [Fistulina hepatica ATCC 64428]|uniref:PLP-dependent transferase n=1 Tax=Fistulina hepatica ATCC 64428 TaxID=1128425 RepID=A0A0D7AQI4_9AGAR|nr:PLP-dependent transferase [Fistulina hepatica ATCC 64428]